MTNDVIKPNLQKANDPDTYNRYTTVIHANPYSQRDNDYDRYSRLRHLASITVVTGQVAVI